MPVGEEALGFLDGFSAAFAIKAFIILLVIFYLVFALILYRQTQLMVRALPMHRAPILKFIAFLQMGIALAFLFLVIGVF